MTTFRVTDKHVGQPVGNVFGFFKRHFDNEDVGKTFRGEWGEFANGGHGWCGKLSER